MASEGVANDRFLSKDPSVRLWPAFCLSPAPEAKTGDSLRMRKTGEYVAKSQRFQGPRPDQLASLFDEVPHQVGLQMLRELERLPSVDSVDVNEPPLQSLDSNRTSPIL